MPRNVRLAEAPEFGKPALQHEPDSRGALAYLALAGEMLRREDEAPAQRTECAAAVWHIDYSAMTQKKPTLGRGLADLLGQTPAGRAAAAGDAPPRPAG